MGVFFILFPHYPNTSLWWRPIPYLGLVLVLLIAIGTFNVRGVSS